MSATETETSINRPAHYASVSPKVNLRREAFVEEFMRNGHLAGPAAIAAGSSPKSSHMAAYRMLQEPAVQEMLATRAAKVSDESRLSTREWARDLAACAFSNIGDLYDDGGELRPIHRLPEQVKRAISSVRIVKRTLKDVGTEVTTEIKFWSKTAALETLAKHLGLFEKHNAQQAAAIKVQIELVG